MKDGLVVKDGKRYVQGRNEHKYRSNKSKPNYLTTFEDKPPDVTNKTSQKQTTKQTLIN